MKLLRRLFKSPVVLPAGPRSISVLRIKDGDIVILPADMYPDAVADELSDWLKRTGRENCIVVKT